jgi:phosphatidylglycerophosphate synthase
MKTRVYYIINYITLYRIITAPIMVWLIFTGNVGLFSILLPISFFTDLIDGPLARKYKVTSVFGSKLDSIGDDLTILAGIIGVFVFRKSFIEDNKIIVWTLLLLLIIQNLAALLKYRKITSFHTYLAKAAAIFQGTFLIFFFLLPEPIYPLFYIASFISILDLTEEIVLVLILKKWESDVRGIYWVVIRSKYKYDSQKKLINKTMKNAGNII